MTSPIQPLGGKRALVTGGSRGIGAAIVRRLAADGAAVAFTYVSRPDSAEALVAEIEANGGTAFALRADSGNVPELQGAVDEAASRLGGLDILVNNAGIIRVGMIDTTTVEDFDIMINVNVRSMYFATQAAVRHMQSGGRVINIGSNVAARSVVAGSSLYTLSKSTITAMGRALANDLGPRGITINTVQPGPTVTDMTPADGPHIPRLLAMMPVGRMAEASEIAGLVAYLAGSESGFITGAGITIDGGMST